MINRKATARISFITLLLSIFFSVSAQAQEGEALFKSNCLSCHGIDKPGTGPALRDVESRWGSREEIYQWVHNWKDAVNAGIPQALKIQSYSATEMTPFPALKNQQIDAILDYIASVPPPAPAGPGNAAVSVEAEKDNSLLYGILTLILAIIALTLLYVNSNLRKLSDEKEVGYAPEPVPFYRNKTYILMFALFAFVLGGYWVAKGATALGRSKNYQPKQPIFYSHKVHAGTNQISCLYCHSGVQDGKQATLPSVNVCMNCHMNISKYEGEPLFDADGKEVNGTAEIQKLWDYAGYAGGGAIWQPNEKTRPIPWVKIHNLPDHVYFNHSQHVNPKVGNQACQTCHGNVQDMLGEVKQFSDLSMGWCVNCHRNTEVGMYSRNDTTGQESGNRFYRMYSKLYQEAQAKDTSLKSAGKYHFGNNKVTIGQMGGTECQKCHY